MNYELKSDLNIVSSSTVCCAKCLSSFQARKETGFFWQTYVVFLKHFLNVMPRVGVAILYS